MKLSLTLFTLSAAVLGLGPEIAHADHVRSQGRRFRGFQDQARRASSRHLVSKQSRFVGRGPQFGNRGIPAVPPPHAVGHSHHGPHGHHVADSIGQMYLAYLGRPAEPAGIANWIDHMRCRGANLEDVRIGILTSPECFQRFGCDPLAYVQFLSAQFPGCNLTPHELHFWASRLPHYQGNLNLFCRDMIPGLH